AVYTCLSKTSSGSCTVAEADAPHIVALYQVINDDDSECDDTLVERFCEQLCKMQPTQIKATVRQYFVTYMGLDPAGNSQVMAKVQETVDGMLEYRKIALEEK